jgi:hypothetical protein
MKKFLFGALISTIFISCADKAEEKPVTTEASAPTTTETKKAATEVLDLSEADGIKAGLTAFTKGDIDGMTANFDDNVRYFFSGGDSLIGKQKVKDYYTGRWKLIDSVMYSENVVLPIRINESQSPKYATPGKWVLNWSFAHVKYKNGKWLHFWIHTDYYFNDAGKVATVVQYIDFHPIREATKGMKK